ncbi:hypothetical protein F5Y16DRAFT_387323 [Xylariaceae sp. FL0255]|nr:hypothetical protein F5Y16DRAFT_387323 [Xylariaceae sp. FL0255]
MQTDAVNSGYRGFLSLHFSGSQPAPPVMMRSPPRKVAFASFVAIILVLALTLWNRELMPGIGGDSSSGSRHFMKRPGGGPIIPDDLPGLHDLPIHIPGAGKSNSLNHGNTNSDSEDNTNNNFESSSGLSDFLSYSESDLELDLVVASTTEENTTWFEAHLPNWHKSMYVVDKFTLPFTSISTGHLTVPKNKGREAMVYLTYIIDNYDRLPQMMLFLHASRFAWHNDDPDYDALAPLRNLQTSHLQTVGYVNLRCVWTIGCPAEIRPVADAAKTKAEGKGKKVTAAFAYLEAFKELLPGIPVPDIVAVSCCSQFGVTREMVRARSLAEWTRWRQWLLDTPLEDAVAGRVFEFAWHIIFGKDPVHCPLAADCYCNVFGLCDIPCKEKGVCEGQYTLPPYSTLPKGWPTVDWGGQPRNFSGPL